MTRPRLASPPAPELVGVSWNGSPYCFYCIERLHGAEIFSAPPRPPLAAIFSAPYICACCGFDAVAGWLDGPRPAPRRPRLAPRRMSRPRPPAPRAPGPVMAQLMAAAAAMTAAAVAPYRLQLPAPRPALHPGPAPTLRNGAAAAGWKDCRILTVKDLPPTPAASDEMEPARPGAEPRYGWGYHNWTPAELAWLREWKKEQDAGLIAFMKEKRDPPA